MPRRFWSAKRESGFWEDTVQKTWAEAGRFFPDWETRQYKDTFRVDKDTFWFLYQRYGVLLAKNVCLRTKDDEVL
ncbi:hypothetical protein WJX75_000762 [Coccomyxa subellipsoidea]|uniref:Acetyl-coenzyme A synthetase N-terminal domain-containing protein n=1 Tax=Coccomyxa subellipsoidea TaxID=248742 RepID=A0ABR2YX73_9CHLO